GLVTFELFGRGKSAGQSRWNRRFGGRFRSSRRLRRQSLCAPGRDTDNGLELPIAFHRALPCLYRIGLNSVPLHRGHLPAASSGTGFVKCLIYWQSLHFHRIERCSCDCSICFNAFMALSRIASRSAFSVVSGGSIDSIPSAEVWFLTGAIFGPRDAINMLSCSYEHIEPIWPCPVQKLPRCELLCEFAMPCLRLVLLRAKWTLQDSNCRYEKMKRHPLSWIAALFRSFFEVTKFGTGKDHLSTARCSLAFGTPFFTVITV